MKSIPVSFLGNPMKLRMLVETGGNKKKKQTRYHFKLTFHKVRNVSFDRIQKFSCFFFSPRTLWVVDDTAIFTQWLGMIL